MHPDKKLLKNILILLVFIFPIINSNNLGSAKNYNRVIDPFPKEILNHKIFKIFRNENRLGYTSGMKENKSLVTGSGLDRKLLQKVKRK